MKSTALSLLLFYLSGSQLGLVKGSGCKSYCLGNLRKKYHHK